MKVTVPRLFDPHVHLREDSNPYVMRDLIGYSISGGASVIAFMPNTKSGLKRAPEVTGYQNLANHFAGMLSPEGSVLRIIPIAMLTEVTTKAMIDDWVSDGIKDCKVYPRFRTTQSQDGVRAYSKIMHLIAYCGVVGVRVHFHPENPNMLFGNRDAEYQFIPVMEMMLEQAPHTVFVWEHGSDRRCIPFWKEWAKIGLFYVTITAHHLLTNEDDSYGDVRAVCKPNPKKEEDRQALIQLITEGRRWVMAGSDSAFHDESAKHTAVGRCACGAFTAPNALAMYAQALRHLIEETEYSLSARFGDFTSQNAKWLYNINYQDVVTLEFSEEGWEVPKTYPVGNETALPFMAGEKLNWRIAPQE